MRRTLACVLLLLAAGCAGIGPAPAPEPPGAIFAADGSALTEDELAAALDRAAIVVLGEVHDNPVHHARQARLVRHLRPQGMAFEMVPSASEEGIQVFLAQGGSRRGIGPAIGWERMGWPDWELYRPVFAAARGAYIAGGGVARSDLRTARLTGAAGVYGKGARRLGLDRPLDAALRAEIEDEMIAAHCNKLPREAAAGMVESQRLRDARFAAAALRALLRGGGDSAVLITGNGHARTDRGVPAYLRVAGPDLAVLSVGMIEIEPDADPAAAAGGLPFDFVWFSGPVEREDPCAAFG
jgi:uncharacterized iron-regulated protein